MREKTLYKLLSLVLAVILLLSPLPVKAAVTSGQCGPNLYWSYNDYILTISGSGEMYDFVAPSPGANPDKMPWYNYMNRISWIEIEEGCTYIGSYAFYNCSTITEVFFPENSLKSIGNYAFSNIINLYELHLPDSLERIGTNAFSNCSNLTYIDFGKGLESIPNNICCKNPLLTTVILPENCKTIGTSAFEGCTALTDVSFSQIEEFQSSCFYGCALTRAEFGKNLKVLRTSAFSNCSSLSEVCFDDRAEPKYISSSFADNTPYSQNLENGIYILFDGKVLMNNGTYTGTSFDIPEGVEIISDFAFSGSPNLQEISFPSSLRVIGSYAFRDCPKLNSVFVPATVIEICENALGKVTSGMLSVNKSPFVLHGLGICEAALYAENEQLPYVCDHDFVYKYDLDDCAFGGTKRLVCTFCGCCIERTVIAPGEHSFDVAEEIAPACTGKGYLLLRCLVCGAVKKAENSPPTGHFPEEKWTLVSLPDQTNRGLVARLCKICGEPADRIELERTDEIWFSENSSAPFYDTVRIAMLESMRDTILCKKNFSCIKDIDFYSDGEFNVCDILAFRRISER